jgi:argininosuccinate lyase
MALAVTAEMMAALIINKETATSAASDPALLATDLADELVRKNVPFRKAHDLVGQLAAESAKTGIPLDRLPKEIILAICPKLIGEWEELFNPIRSLKARSATGGPSPENVSMRLAYWRNILA